MASYKKYLREIAEPVLGFEPLLYFARQVRLHNKIVVLMYHEIAEDSMGIDAWTVVRQSEFIRQMQYLKRHYEIISLTDAISRMHDNKINSPTIVITFDDGYSGNKRVLLPIVNNLKIPVTIFIATGFIEEQKLYWYDQLLTSFENTGTFKLDLRSQGLDTYRINYTDGVVNWCEKERLLGDLKLLFPDMREKYVIDILSLVPKSTVEKYRFIAPLNIVEVRQLSDCPFVTIGAHSHCHNILTQLDVNAMQNSVYRSKEKLESWINRSVNCFAYPNGNFNSTIASTIQKMNFNCALTTRSSLWTKKDSLYSVPRIGVGRYDSLNMFKAKISGVFKYA
jgi:peptidoglycan/xylan/chitin deacetylase (PgdA/CDA1 family)